MPANCNSYSRMWALTFAGLYKVSTVYTERTIAIAHAIVILLLFVRF